MKTRAPTTETNISQGWDWTHVRYPSLKKEMVLMAVVRMSWTDLAEKNRC